MLNASLTQRINRTRFRRAATQSFYPQGAVATPQSGVVSFERATSLPAGEEKAESTHRLTVAAKFTRVAEWAKIVTIALLTVAGIMALDLVVLWVAAGRLIERIPF
jgi:hypothetical protein